MENKIMEFPPKYPVEKMLVDDLKNACYQYSDRISVAQVIGCFHIAISEIFKEQEHE